MGTSQTILYSLGSQRAVHPFFAYAIANPMFRALKEPTMPIIHPSNYTDVHLNAIHEMQKRAHRKITLEQCIFNPNESKLDNFCYVMETRYGIMVVAEVEKLYITNPPDNHKVYRVAVCDDTSPYDGMWANDSGRHSFAVRELYTAIAAVQMHEDSFSGVLEDDKEWLSVTAAWVTGAVFPEDDIIMSVDTELTNDLCEELVKQLEARTPNKLKFIRIVHYRDSQYHSAPFSDRVSTQRLQNTIAIYTVESKTLEMHHEHPYEVTP